MDMYLLWKGGTFRSFGNIGIGFGRYGCHLDRMECQRKGLEECYVLPNVLTSSR